MFVACHTSVGRGQVSSQPVTGSQVFTRETAGERSQKTVRDKEGGRKRKRELSCHILSHRLGGGKSDVEEVKSYKFFQTINWDDVYHKRIPPPFVPHITSPTSTDYFDKMFTDQNPQLTPPTSETLSLSSSSSSSYLLSPQVLSKIMVIFSKIFDSVTRFCMNVYLTTIVHFCSVVWNRRV